MLPPLLEGARLRTQLKLAAASESAAPSLGESSHWHAAAIVPRSGQDLHEPIHLLRRIATTEAETDSPLQPLSREAHGAEDV